MAYAVRLIVSSKDGPTTISNRESWRAGYSALFDTLGYYRDNMGASEEVRAEFEALLSELRVLPYGNDFEGKAGGLTFTFGKSE